MSFVSRFKDATIGFVGYPRLAQDPSGGFGYLALLLLIVMTLSGVIATQQVRTVMSEAAQEVARGPDFVFENGQLTFTGPMPYRMGQGGGATITVDTTGQTTEAVLKGAKPGSMLITRDKFYQVSNFSQIQATDLSLLKLRLHKADVIDLMARFHWFVPVGYLFAYAFQLGFKALDAVILALIALLYGRTLRQEVSFNLGFKLGLYAMSLPIVIQWLYPNFYTYRLYGFVIWWGLAVLFLIMGLRTHLAASAEQQSAFFTPPKS